MHIYTFEQYSSLNEFRNVPGDVADTFAAERFWAKVDKPDNKKATCWTWAGYVDKAGYGVFRYKNKNMAAHRASYLINNGEIGEGLVIRHTCDNPQCVRPSHLIPGTQLENMLDKVERDRAGRGVIKSTHCPKGHEYADPEHYYLNGHKQGCRTCRNERSKLYAAAKRKALSLANR